MGKHSAETVTVSEMDVEELRVRTRKARDLLGQLVALLPGLIHMSVDERRHTKGRLKVGESEAMKKLLVAAGKHPQLFVALADKDGGKDPKLFEPQPAIDHLDRVAVLQGLSAEVALLGEKLSDTLLSLGTSARAVVTPVHDLINATRAIHPQLATDAAEGMEFYAAHGRQASRTRAKAKREDTEPEGESE